MLLGYAVLEYGDAPRARALLEPVVAEFERFGFPQWHGWAATHTAEALRLEGRLAEAAAAAQRGLEVARQAQYWYAVAFSHRVRGRIARDEGRLGEAAAELAQALSTFERIGGAFEAARTRLDVAMVARASGDPDRAQREMDAACRAFEELDTPAYRARADRLASDPAAGPAG